MEEMKISEMRAVLEGRTKGEWRIYGRAVVNVVDGKRVERDRAQLGGDIALCEYPSDAEFIAKAPRMVAQLLAEVESLRKAQGWPVD